ncbi:hypothetical protein [Allosaccharopolyspora coralli]|uniref:hypothetical protein n=1 Tax=Allosaccharopolyspora coralli TaxID=2665642 RepID=UPI001E34D7E2|nr:hypothetical protein [Allosaccharopolyspora coralli]
MELRELRLGGGFLVLDLATPARNQAGVGACFEGLFVAFKLASASCDLLSQRGDRFFVGGGAAFLVVRELFESRTDAIGGEHLG